MNNNKLLCCLVILISVSVYGDKKENKKGKSFFGNVFSKDTKTEQIVPNQNAVGNTNNYETVLIPEKLRTLSVKESKLFLRMVAEREKIRNRVEVLSGMLNDKKDEAVDIRDELIKDYKLPKSQTYIVSPSDWRLYETDKTLNIGEELYHFKSDKDYRLFCGIYYEMKSIVNDYKNLRDILLDQKVLYNVSVKKLDQGFDVKEAERYKYDSNTRTIYILKTKQFKK
jgi:hypothetical protein